LLEGADFKKISSLLNNLLGTQSPSSLLTIRADKG
jgi:hypothetical protein